MNSFNFGNRTFIYCCYEYNHTRLNERAVEVPIALDFVMGFNRNQIIEVGNVLQHYDFTGHTVIDKYETGNNVMNCDVLEYVPKRRYDCLVSVSTIEHFGNWNVIEQSIAHMMTWLSDSGVYLFTMPYGFNRDLDKHIASLDPMRLDKVDFTQHLWQEIRDDRVPLAYNGETKWANTVWIVKGF